MAGVNTILRIIGATLALVVIAFTTAVGYTLMDPISTQLGAPSVAGWTDVNFLYFASLGFIGLTLVVIVWLIVAPVRNDVRQDVRRP